MAPSRRRGSDDTDEALVARACGGDAAAFESLHDRYAGVVTAVVRSETRNLSDAPDIVQEVFVSAWTRIGSLRDPARFRAWVLQIARHAVIDHGRAVGRRPRLDADDALTLELVAAEAPGPADFAELGVLAEQVETGIDGLSRRDATAITLAAQFGFGPTEIADALGVTPNNAKVILHRARARLRAALA